MKTVVFAPKTAVFAVSILISLSMRTARAEGPAAPAMSESTDEALIAQGIELRKKGQDAEALALFERANSLYRSPRAVVQIALAQQALGHWPQAEVGLMDALHEADDPWIVRHRGHLEESLAAVQVHLSSLQVESNIAGAEVWIAGGIVGRLPLERPLRITCGDVTVEVRAAGYPAMVQTMHVEAKSQVHAAFTFALPPAAITEQPKRTLGDEPRPAETSSSAARTAGWISLASAGGLALVGGAGLVTREEEAQTWNNDAQCGPVGGQSRANRCGTNRDIGTTALTLGIVAFAASGVAATISGVLLLGTSRASRPNHARQIACSFGAWLRCGGTF